jgi:hypothetical protein
MHCPGSVALIPAERTQSVQLAETLWPPAIIRSLQGQLWNGMLGR